MTAIVFATRLADDDWSTEQGAWRCEPLRIPGATVKDLRVDGNTIDKSQYQVRTELAMVHWVGPGRPPRVAAEIELSDELSLAKDTDRWKKLAVLLPVIGTIAAALIAGTATYLTTKSRYMPDADSALSTICQFNDGWHDYSPMPPAQIGLPCNDGLGNIGVIVAKGAQHGPRR